MTYARRIILHFWWWTIGGGLLLVAGGWAIYVVDWYLFLARSFPAKAPAGNGLTALLADVQGYAVAFGPLGIVVVGLVVSRALRLSPPRSTPGTGHSGSPATRSG